MESNNAVESPPSDHLSALALRVLIKTVLKCGIWFGLAWLITRFMPDAMWPWYTAWAFAAIGLLFSLLMLGAAFMARRQELASGREPPG
jgi:hypothetical protein